MAYVVKSLEAPIAAGGAEVQVEIVRLDGGSVHADLNVTAPLDDINWSYDDIVALRRLCEETLAYMKAAR
jgi:hypothetical protein